MNRLLFLLPASLLFLLVPACEGGGEGSISPSDDDDSAGLDDDDAADDDDFTATNSSTISFTTSDGVEIQGTWQAGYGSSSGPGVVLLHQITRDRGDFQTVWFNFIDAGVSVLAIDFRGHGTSDPSDLEYEELMVDPDQLKWDVIGAIDWLASQPEVDPARVGVMGLDVGANMAVVANHNRAEWGAKCIVTLSADMEAIALLAGTTELDLECGQFVAAENEHPQAEDATALHDGAANPKDLKLVLDTDDHGIDLLAGSGDAQVGTVEWLAENL